MFYCSIESPIGKLILAEENEKLSYIFFEDIKRENAIEKQTDLLKEAVLQISEYFKGSRKAFSLPINFVGTPFQLRVWQELCKIPYGKTVSYGELAKQIGSPKAARAVGMANNRNPLPIIVPCHRVIGANGKLVGYRGGIDKKIHLLKLEAENS